MQTLYRHRRELYANRATNSNALDSSEDDSAGRTVKETECVPLDEGGHFADTDTVSSASRTIASSSWKRFGEKSYLLDSRSKGPRKPSQNHVGVHISPMSRKPSSDKFERPLQLCVFLLLRPSPFHTCLISPRSPTYSQPIVQRQVAPLRIQPLHPEVKPVREHLETTQKRSLFPSMSTTTST